MIVFLIILFIFIPFGIIFLTEKYTWINRIGAVIVAYVFGIALGHSGIMPRMGDNLKAKMQSEVSVKLSDVREYVDKGEMLSTDVLAYEVYRIQDVFTSITIPLALPLLLFSLKIKVWLRMSGKTIASMLFAIVSLIVFIVLGHLLYRQNLNCSNKVAGMLVGLYTGGTPNLASLKQTLNVDNETYIMTHTYDTVVGLLYLLFLMSIGKSIFRRFLVPYPTGDKKIVHDEIEFSERAYNGIFSKKNLADMAKAFVISLAIVVLSVVLALVFRRYFMLTAMLSITTFSIIASSIKRVNMLEKTFELGMFFIVMFSFVVATMADIHELINISSTLLAYITLVYFGTLILHFILCKIFKVDADTLMVTSTALLCSPPFVPMVATSLRNKEVIVAGLAVGIMGYAIGNYLGVLIAGLLI
jgi:uncharacterized membrane protein